MYGSWHSFNCRFLHGGGWTLVARIERASKPVSNGLQVIHRHEDRPAREDYGVTRPTRLDFPGAIHLIVMHGRADAAIFFNPDLIQGRSANPYEHAPAVRQFEALLTQAHEEYDALIHAYAVLPNTAMIVLQTSNAPLEWIMHDMRGQYACQVGLSGGSRKGESIFQGRYSSKVIAPMYFPHAVRRVHQAPAVAGLCSRIDYPFSSDAAYRRRQFPQWLNKQTLYQSLGRRDYGTFMDEKDTPHIQKLFTHGWPRAHSIVGNFDFVKLAESLAGAPRHHPSREQLIDVAAGILKVSGDVVRSKTHVGALARGLVASYALRTGAATRVEVGRWFGLTGSAVTHAIRYHRGTSPHYFNIALDSLFVSSSIATSRMPLGIAQQFMA